jgi:hypothetical protein
MVWGVKVDRVESSGAAVERLSCARSESCVQILPCSSLVALPCRSESSWSKPSRAVVLEMRPSPFSPASPLSPPPLPQCWTQHHRHHPKRAQPAVAPSSALNSSPKCSPLASSS